MPKGFRSWRQLTAVKLQLFYYKIIIYILYILISS
jgi:hypothetical protein